MTESSRYLFVGLVIGCFPVRLGAPLHTDYGSPTWRRNAAPLHCVNEMMRACCQIEPCGKADERMHGIDECERVKWVLNDSRSLAFWPRNSHDACMLLHVLTNRH